MYTVVAGMTHNGAV